MTSEKENEIILISKLTDLERFCLDAYIVSDEKDTEKVIKAYLLSRPKESEANKQAVYVQARRWVNTDKCKAYIKAKRERIIIVGENGDEENEEVTRSKDELIILINKQLTRAEQANDTKTIDSLVKNLTELQQLKKQDTTDENSQIKYFMPLKCNDCVIYNNAKLAHLNNEKLTD